MHLTEQDGRRFLQQVRPLFIKQDPEALLNELSRGWPNPALTALLTCSCDDVVKAALVCLSLTGTMRESAFVASKLPADDPMVTAFAEHALWSIWFRSDDERASRTLREAVDLTIEGAYECAIGRLDALIRRYPAFAEPYHQRASACFLTNRLAQAERDSGKAIRLNPVHFGAMTILGHCYATKGSLAAANEMYQAAIRVHPRHDQARQAVQCIMRRIAEDTWQPTTTIQPRNT